MPIQFRCGSCQQLLGIARRKAGAIVLCPTCQQKTRVPIVKENSPPPEPRGSGKPGSFFDRVDVEKLLSPPQEVARAGSGAESGAAVAEIPASEKHRAGRPVPLEDNKEIPRFDKKPLLDLVQEDAPFTLENVSPLPPVSRSRNLGMILGLTAVAVFLAAGAFFAGHWVGAHRPWF